MQDALINPAPVEEFELSDWQRARLLGFIERFDSCYSDGSFDKDAGWSDVELLVIALRAAGILGYQRESLEQLFRDEFNVEGLTEGVLSTALSIAMMADAEQRLLCACGGKN